MVMNQQSKRATFEDVGFAQDKLLDFIDICIEENRVLTKGERKNFIKNLRLATLGLDTEYQFFIGKQQHPLGHVGHAAYWLAYQKTNPIIINGESIEVKQFWIILRDLLFKIFPHAIEMSVKIIGLGFLPNFFNSDA